MRKYENFVRIWTDMIWNTVRGNFDECANPNQSEGKILANDHELRV